jgi:predicted ATP-binding protein involved in virulence
MAYVIKRISIKGFLGYKNINVELDPGVNFLIGRNGTGKTTFIRLLHAVLEIDPHNLASFHFDEITVTYQDDGKGTSPQLKIEKVDPRRSLFRFSFRSSGSQKYRVFSDNRNDLVFFIGEHLKESAIRKKNAHNAISELRKLFRDNVKFSWLPLSRTVDFSRSYIDEDDGTEYYRDPIDNKVNELVNSMTSYFSVLDSRTAAETRAFQEAYFLSLISFKAPSVSSIISGVKRHNLPSQKEIVTNILSEMGLSDLNISTELNKFYNRAQSAADNVDKQSSGLLLDDIFAVADFIRLQEIVERFKQYEEKKRAIQRPKTDLSELMTSMLLNKRFFFNEANQPVVINSITERPIELSDLSSGEKQLFVIFCETLLQNRGRYVFLADEPELSLHIDWQEGLVRNIRKLNGNCQIIFATHSPDVVSVYQDRVIDFEKL